MNPRQSQKFTWPSMAWKQRSCPPPGGCDEELEEAFRARCTDNYVTQHGAEAADKPLAE